jgi:hypothetical protein
MADTFCTRRNHRDLTVTIEDLDRFPKRILKTVGNLATVRRAVPSSPI